MLKNSHYTIGYLYATFHTMREELQQYLYALEAIEEKVGRNNEPFKTMKKLFDEKSREVTEFEKIEMKLVTPQDVQHWVFEDDL